MLRRISAVLVAGICTWTLQAAAHPAPKHPTRNSAKTVKPAQLVASTSSAKARDLYQRAMQDNELLYLERAMIGWRAAVKEDPLFASAFVMLAMNSRDPEEIRASRERAKELAPKASEGEKLLIQWVSNVQEGHDLAGIAAMNDLLAMFPRDKHLYYMAANWLMGTRGNDQAHRLLHKALDIDPDFAPALNNMAYLHARSREFGEALEDMDRYVELLPSEPNPQDSYAEISRMAGFYDVALEHYRAALKIDPNFRSSMVGLGDTYALMGAEEQARIEYDKAIQIEPDAAYRFDDRMQKAISWVREKNYTEADRELWRVATEAHLQSYELQEAQALRQMAQYGADDKMALERLASAKEALTHRQNLSAADRDPEHALILRLRAARATHLGARDMAQAALNTLGEMASSSRNRVILECWHGATGEALMAQGKFQEAIPELEEDSDNPESVALLVKAYSQADANDKSKQAEDRLRATHLPTLEQALAMEMDRNNHLASEPAPADVAAGAANPQK